MSPLPYSISSSVAGEMQPGDLGLIRLIKKADLISVDAAYGGLAVGYKVVEEEYHIHPDLVKKPEAICKGAWELGTACGECSRCRDTAMKYIKSLEQSFDMYVNAWVRELGGYRNIRNKAHRIDALVVTTQDMKRKADRFDREFAQDMPREQYAEMAAPWFEL